jgi:hypothetical protein
MFPTKATLYTVTEEQAIIQSLAAAAKTFEVMDCPHCGHQQRLGERLTAASEHKTLKGWPPGEDERETNND